MAPAVVVQNVSKSFRRYHPNRPWTVQEAVARGLRRMGAVERFWALRDVSFRVAAGRTTGIVGANGSGKSTLLRLIGGVGRPDAGSLQVRGRLGALLDLGVGFHADLTGRENAMLSGILNGLTRRQVLERLEAIVAFAEVEKFIDNPMRTYSTGMQMRLAFSTAVHAEPEILLIDEVLSVGDIAFQRKCLDRIAQFKAAGCSILLVSHEASVIQDLCDEALWLSAGRVMAHGSTSDVLRDYLAHMAARSDGVSDAAVEEPRPFSSTPRPTVRTERGAERVLNEQRFGSPELEIEAVGVFDDRGEPLAEMRSGQPVRIDIAFVATGRLVAPLFRIRIFREDGLVCCDVDSELTPLSVAAVHGRGRVSVHLERLDLNSGRYVVDVGCYAQDWTYAYDYRSSVHALVVRGESGKQAVLNVPHRWERVDSPMMGPGTGAVP
jgi:lipopolysaccharide transport system ATP-binding protein